MAYSPTLRHLQISGDVFTAALMNAIRISETTGDVIVSNIATFSSTGLAITGTLGVSDNLTLSKATSIIYLTGATYGQVEATVGSLYLSAPTAKNVHMQIAGSDITTVSSTGLAVTGQGKFTNTSILSLIPNATAANIGTENNYPLRFYVNNGAHSAEITASGIAVTASGVTQSVKVGQLSTATTYGAISFNGTLTASGITGIFGGGGGDNNLNLNAPTGYTVNVKVNDVSVTSTSSTSFAVTGSIAAKSATEAQIYVEKTGANASYAGIWNSGVSKGFYDWTAAAHVWYKDASNLYLYGAGTNSTSVGAAGIYSSIFYDKENTGYYMDGNGNTNLNAIYIASTARFYAGLIARNSSDQGYVSLVAGNATNSGYIDFNTAAGVRTMYLGYADATWNYFQCENGRDFNFGGGYIQNDESVRAPIFYDSNDTGYYFDGVSTSRCVALIVGGTSGNPYDGASSGSLWFGVSGNNAYRIYTQLEDVSGNYTKLTLDWHTGIRIAAYSTYGGTRFYNNAISSGGTKIFSIGEGDNHARAYNNLYVTGNVYSNYSDDRLKTRLGNIENALEKILSLDGFYYEPNEVAQGFGYERVRDVGVSAQATQKILPEIVGEALVGKSYLTVRYEKFIPLLIEAIKELKKELDLVKNK